LPARPPPPRKKVDFKATEPFRRRLPGPHDPGGDEAPPRGPLSQPLPADAAAIATEAAASASDGPLPLPVQTPSPAMPNAKVILDGGSRMRAQMDTQYTRRPEQPGQEPVVHAAPPRDFSIPPPPRKSRLALVAVVIVALLGIGVFAFLASQMQGPPAMTPTPTVTAPPAVTNAVAPTPTVAPSEPAPAAATATEAPVVEPPPSATTAPPSAPTSKQGQGRNPAPRSSGPRTPPKKWQPNLPDRL
jgi:hypothetical protein